ncbi:MAG: glycosyltransferase [Chlorogloeopsis fritschii C42_A2020_084]|uniref:glycosyltransferase family 2 protein n=1 Tax=Chlorogloeopsis fritschii TaxID=1124 RepID=UPI0019F22492|nr:glycosyltransferase [Chlorogloeopsis fritschii]MBF2008407.1 glycosyltransferase [Chlorogloeopsis fritschii C42_A2020_084]
MKEAHPYRALIQPVPEETVRPLWSVMIPTYNCANYLRETLASVLVQDPGPELMQIEVIDDHSTHDDPEAVVREVGKGRVEFYRQPENVGYIRNFETCLQRSRGHLIHLLHGDDCVGTGFYNKLQTLFEQYPEIGSAFCRQIIVDDQGHWKGFSKLEQEESGILDNWLERIAAQHSVQTPSVVVKRAVYEQLGGFDRRLLSCGEDWEMWVRIAAHHPVAYEVEPLALYRDRSNSLTKRSVRTGQNIRDVRRATEIIRDYLPLPAETTNKVCDQAGETWALWAFHFAQEAIIRGDITTAIAQMREGIQCSHSLKTTKRTAQLTLKLIKKMIRQRLQLNLSLNMQKS